MSQYGRGLSTLKHMLDLRLVGMIHEVPPGCPDEIAVFEIIEEEPKLR